MKSTNLVLFDFDGTISDSHVAAMETYNTLSVKYGFRRVEVDDLDELRRISSREVLKKLGISPIKLPFVVREARLKFGDRVHTLQPFDGMVDSLTKLKNLGLKLGILTSNSKKNVHRFLTANQMDVFDVVYSGASIFGKSKVIKTVLKNERLATHEAVYVGDETRDIEAAKAAGIRVISVSWGFNTKEILRHQSPDFLVDSPIQLFEVCRDLFASVN